MSITLDTRTETVVLYQDDDMHRIDELAAQALAAVAHREEARARRDVLREQLEDAPRFGGDEDPVTALDALVEVADEAAKAAAEAHDTFVNEAAERAAKVKVRALPRKQWRALKLAHPMRVIATPETKTDATGTEVLVYTEQPHDDDQAYGFNTETMPDALVPPALDELGQFATPAARDAFIDGLSEPDFKRIYDWAVYLSDRSGRAPKAEASSLLAQIGAATSR